MHSDIKDTLEAKSVHKNIEKLRFKPTEPNKYEKTVG